MVIRRARLLLSSFSQYSNYFNLYVEYSKIKTQFFHHMFYSFNSFLLSNLAQTMRAGPDLKSFVLRRFQVLAVIYVNLCCGLLAFLWNIICLIGYPLPCLGVNLAVYPLLILSFVFLKRGNHNLAAASVIGYFHLTPLLKQNDKCTVGWAFNSYPWPFMRFCIQFILKGAFTEYIVMHLTACGHIS